MKVEIAEYDINWDKEYKSEKDKIIESLNDKIINIYHIGSTSIPNLKAKPIIDILLVVENINDLDLYTTEFENLGYEPMGEFGIKGRRYFRKGGENRTHQIHAFQYDNLYDIKRHLIFKDYLKAHENIAKEYENLKLKLANKYPNSSELYSDGKDCFVKRVEKEAMKWYFKEIYNN